MNYEEAIEYIKNSNKSGIKLGLHNMGMILQTIGEPQKNLRIIHVAGTNGKGSTCCLIASVLKEQGYKVGLYTSPELDFLNEMIQINGESISNENFVRGISVVKAAVEKIQEKDISFQPTEFEIITSAAFECFRHEDVDFVVLEVGLGGRYDATNIIDNSLMSIITPISMDHMQFLGNDIDKIAYEKCGIIKPNSLTVTAVQENRVNNIIEEVSIMNGTELIKAEKCRVEVLSQGVDGQLVNLMYEGSNHTIKLKLLGKYQIINCQTAFVALTALTKNGIIICEDSIKRGMEKAIWPGRFEVVSKKPIVIADGAHNKDGMKVLAESLQAYFSGRKILLVLGILKDKEIEDMVKLIVPYVDRVILTEPENERKLSVQELKKIVMKFSSKVVTCPNCVEAVKMAVNEVHPNEVVCIAGSLYLVGKIRGLFYGPSGRVSRV